DSSIDVEARGSHATHCVISGNVMEITAPEENHDVTLECLPDDQAVELVVTQNRIAVAGTQSDARIDSTGTGTTIITDNTIGVGESLTLGADGNPLTVLNNQLSANRITLSRRYAGNTPTRFSFNNVSATEVGN